MPTCKHTLRLFKPIMTAHKKASIHHLTDSEGHAPSFIYSIHHSPVVQYTETGELAFRDEAENPYFIFGGDLTDRGVKDIELTKKLLHFKLRHPDRVFLLVGNREASKARIHIELNPKYVRQRLLEGDVPHWLKHHPHKRPADYVLQHRLQHAKDAFGDLKTYIDALSLKECQLIYLKWMLEQNLGCPQTFHYHAQELAHNTKRKVEEINDYEVLQSLLSLCAPEGLMGQYLQQTQMGVIIPDTGVLAIHGGLTLENTGRLPGMSPTDTAIADAHSWMQQLNGWFQSEVRKWATTDLNTVPLQLQPAKSPLDCFSTASPALFRSVVTSSMLDSQRRFVPVPMEVCDYLTRNKLNVVLTGHQPSGDHPALLRSPNDKVLFINGDTSYASPHPQHIHNTRGVTAHSLQIFTGEITHIQIKARLQNGQDISTVFTMNTEGVLDSTHTGKILPEYELVQCQLPDGNYRLVHQEGFRVRYNVLTPDEIEEKMHLHFITPV